MQWKGHYPLLRVNEKSIYNFVNIKVLYFINWRIPALKAIRPGNAVKIMATGFAMLENVLINTQVKWLRLIKMGNLFNAYRLNSAYHKM